MIATLLATLPFIALGWVLVRLLLPAQANASAPAWLRWMMEISLGTGLGAGLVSCVYFLLVWSKAASRAAELGFEGVALACAAWLLGRRKRGEEQPGLQPRFTWNWALRVAAVLALLLFLLDFSQAIGASPDGEWDAFSIWNVRARFLAGGDATWRYAVAAVSAGHPRYPLLLSASVARMWVLAGGTSSFAPATLSLLFTLATVGLMCGMLAWMRAESAALLALLVALATEGFVSQAASQYADVPLSFFILATVGLLAYASEHEWPPGALALAGLAAGLAAWTKNEGAPFLLVAVAAVAWRGWRRGGRWRGAWDLGRWMAAGAAPAALTTAAFKLWVAPRGVDADLPRTVGEAFARLGNPGRWGQVAGSFARNFVDLGAWWAHPILLLAVLGFVLGFVRKQEAKSRLWLLALVAGVLAADIGAYLTGTSELGWRLATSNIRLLVQVWPAALFVFFLIVRPPITPEPEPVAVAAGKAGGEVPRRRKKR